MQIADRCVASFHYTLTDDAGAVIDSSQDREPMSYLHGAGMIVPGLESAMEGRRAGEAFNVDVPPAQGYGLRDEGLVQAVPRAAFQGVDTVEPGMQFQAQGPQGALTVTVREVGDDTVTVDANHPLAGATLHFAIEVTDVREASEDEIAHGHAHGPGGAH